jgi:pimeloyl-ACP methyl ester carboxylesterase
MVETMKHRYSYLIVIVVSLAMVSIAAACAASARTIDKKLDVGGYALRIRCTGQGSPTVVVETGFNDPGVGSIPSSWVTVVKEIEKKTRICVYDRAGIGSSNVATGENRTSLDMVKDLHTLLAKAKIPSPYILVGHSIGGFNVRVFASEYGDEVVGMVLVDSSHPDQWSAVDAVLPPESPDESESIKVYRIIPTADLPEKWDIPASIIQVKAVKPLGNLPLVVITSSPTKSIDPNLPPELAAKIQQVRENLQNDLASLSSNSTHVIATRAGHMVQVDEPQLVIDAILKVIEELKK